MIPLILSLILWAWAFVWHTRRNYHSAWIRWSHRLLLLSIGAFLVSVSLGLSRSETNLMPDPQRGLILLDVSASTMENDRISQLELKLRKHLASRSRDRIEWASFANGCLPPHGNGSVGLNSDLQLALQDLGKDPLNRWDWIWVLTDGGASPPAVLPAFLENSDRFLSALPPASSNHDVGLLDLITDPIW